MATLKRGMIVDLAPNGAHSDSESENVRSWIVVTNNVYNEKVPVIQVVPITSWSIKKARIATNVEILPSSINRLTERSIADCLQTRPLAYRNRLIKMRGQIASHTLEAINKALKIVFELRSE